MTDRLKNMSCLLDLEDLLLMLVVDSGDGMLGVGGVEGKLEKSSRL